MMSEEQAQKFHTDDASCREGNFFQPIGHLATTISILQGFASLCDLALLLFKPHGITKCKYERKNEKDSGRSSKMTSLCKWPIRSTTQIWVACEQQTHFRSSLLSLRKIASANPSSKKNLLFWCWPIRSKDRIQLEWLLATSRAEVSWILARITKYALEREFHDHNKVSCDVECWLLYEATAS